MDLNLLPLARQYGQDSPDLPGLHIAAKPRRAARGRQADRLILYLVMEGNAQISPSQQEQLLKNLAQIYYKTPGSVTAALRAAAETLNQQLLDQNLKEASSGQQGVGLLMLMALREERIYLAQCGPTHAYCISPGGFQHFYDPQPTRRGLGLGRTTPVYFSQISLKENDVLLLAPQPPADWSEATLGSLAGPARSGLAATTSGRLSAPVIISAVGGPTPGSIQVTFTGSLNAPAGQTYTARIYDGDQVAVVRELPRATSPLSVTGLTPGSTYYVTVAADASLGQPEVVSRGRSVVAASTRTAVAAAATATVAVPTAGSNASPTRLGGGWLLVAKSKSATATRVVVKARPSAKAAGAPVVRVPRQRAVSLRVKGLPRNVLTVVEVSIKGAWTSMGQVRTTRTGRLVRAGIHGVGGGEVPAPDDAGFGDAPLSRCRCSHWGREPVMTVMERSL